MYAVICMTCFAPLCLQGLPVRGQRTKTNARTRKGKAKTVSTVFLHCLYSTSCKFRRSMPDGGSKHSSQACLMKLLSRASQLLSNMASRLSQCAPQNWDYHEHQLSFMKLVHCDCPQ
jgi:hypothetical protein